METLLSSKVLLGYLKGEGISRVEDIPEEVYGYWCIDNGEGRWVVHKFPVESEFWPKPWFRIVTENGTWADDLTFSKVLEQRMPNNQKAHLAYWIEWIGGDNAG